MVTDVRAGQPGTAYPRYIGLPALHRRRTERTTKKIAAGSPKHPDHANAKRIPRRRPQQLIRYALERTAIAATNAWLGA
jgi:hypothetical protein